MAVAVDSVGTAQTIVSGNPIGTTHTASGSNRCVRVYVASAGFSGTTASCTYGGVSMTSVGSINNGFASGVGSLCQIFELINPPNTSQSWSVTFSAGSNVGVCQCISYTGVNQSTASGSAFTSAVDAVTSDTVTVTDAASGDWIGGCIVVDTGSSALTAGKTQRANVSDTGYLVGVQDTAGTGSNVGMDWSWTTNENEAHIAVAIKQVSGGTATKLQMMMGAG